MKIIGIIPARMKSSRFPGKPLVDILGMPMVIHVLKRAQLSKKLAEVFVATDSREIFDCVSSYGGKAVMTYAVHQTGTDRIAEASDKLTCDIVVNIQGDEPLVKPKDIDKLVESMVVEPAVNFATLVCKTPQFGEITECKVVMDRNKDIMYMSRSDIPSSTRLQVSYLYKLYCVVAFRKKWLKKFSSWPQTKLEKIEYIEYLRILENGYNFRGVVTDEYTTSVDTPEDLKVILKIMKKDTIKFKYLK
ncbi:MAG: 3-deoxy-manno-octulosonate cytidylyltransferase [Candidatus Omnitrophica bacterium]|nr:3-deoxy-manno-octulosonate cytidylyltransferase [Candidatus Omnitrophota bacterium]